MSEHLSAQDERTEARAKNPGKPSAARSGQGSSLGTAGRDILLAAVRQDVIPRLVAMPHLAAMPLLREAAVDLTPQISESTVRNLTTLCLAADAQAVSVFVLELQRAGVPVGSIYEDLLAPTARVLGVMWENDTCNFADVTIGVLRLQNAQRALVPEFFTTELPSRNPGIRAPRALMLPVPGEQHTFGLSIVLDYFLRAGWDASLGPVGNQAEAVASVKRSNIDMVGLSFACDDHIPTAKDLIRAMRRASANRNLIIMVGGPSFSADPSLADVIGADATAYDGQQAVMRAHELLHRPATQP